MKKIILTILLFTFFLSFSQNIEKIELTKKEIEFLAEDIVSFMREPIAEDFEKSTKYNLTNYIFEISYKDKVIYSGGIKKPSLSDINSAMNRKKASFCFEYDIFDSETKLELAESKKLKLGKTKSGKKYFWTDDYELYKKDRYKGLIVNDKISKKIKIKFYKF